MDHTFPSTPFGLANRPELPHRRPCGDSQYLQRIMVESWRVGGVREVERASVLASPTRSNAVTFSCTAESKRRGMRAHCRSVGPRTRRTTLYHRTTSHFLCFCCCLSFVFHRYLTSTSFAPVPNPIPSTPHDLFSSSIRPPVPVPTLPARNRI